MLAWNNFIIAFTDVLPFAKEDFSLHAMKIWIKTFKKWKTSIFNLPKF